MKSIYLLKLTARKIPQVYKKPYDILLKLTYLKTNILVMAKSHELAWQNHPF